jgi:DNA polymerase-3 subunit gamma/tau
MSYQVLARKWRPRDFSEMVGQEHVLRALINALDNDRLHHAFLFTGTRGVGKTTIARILAKSLNCEQGVSSQPCSRCSACTEIDEGRFVDLIEVDAASRTKVDDTRELLENVQYAPSRGRYKVYLIDEVHMLSTHSFNALLKTLEEPPPHVKFLLATTDPQKLPVTILSRCLQFNLKRLTVELINGQLHHILEQEGIAADPPALLELSRAADGSMRDALSLMDQAIAYGAGALKLAEVREMLGSIDRDRVMVLVKQLAAGSGEGVMAEVSALAEQAPDFSAVLSELTSVLQRIALAQVVPDALDDTLGDREMLLALAAEMSREDVQLYYQIGVVGRRDLPLAPNPRAGFEMTLLRMLAFRPDRGERSQKPGGRGAASVAVPARPPSKQSVAQEPQQQPAAAPTVPSQNDNPPPPPPQAAPAEIVAEAPQGPRLSGSSTQEWVELVAILPLTAMARQFAEHCALVGREGNRFELALDPGFENLRNPKWEEVLQKALSGYLGEPVTINVGTGDAGATVTPKQVREQRQQQAQAAAEQAIIDDPNVQSILEHFDGQIAPGTIRPAE